MKVNLKVKEDNKVETIQHEVEEINLLQLTEAITILKDLLKLAEEDEQLAELFGELFDSSHDGELNETVLLKKAGKAFEGLMVTIPAKAFELLSVLSDTEYDVLMQQKLNDVMDIYDAIIQENDMEKLIKRGKKSLALTKAQVNFQKLFPKPKQEPEQKQLS